MSKLYSVGEMRHALEQAQGMVYIAARLLNCAPQTVYNHLSKHPSLREARETARGMMLDETEIQLMKQVRAGEAWAIKFLLATQGRERGYIERREITGEDGGPVVVKSMMELAKAASESEDIVILDGEYLVLDDPDKGRANGTGEGTD